MSDFIVYEAEDADMISDDEGEDEKVNQESDNFIDNESVLRIKNLLIIAHQKM